MNLEHNLMNENIIIQDLIDKAIANEPREDKKQTSWHASALGRCLCGTYLERLGVEPDEPFDARTLRVFSMGKQIERWVLDKIKETGAEVEEQVRVEDKELNVSGYVDAVVNKIPIEIKSQHSRSFWYMTKQGGANPTHVKQLWMYLYLLQSDFGKLIYCSKDDLAIQEYIVRRDDIEVENDVLAELEVLNFAWEKKLAPPPITDEKDWRYKYCRFHKKCLQTLNK